MNGENLRGLSTVARAMVWIVVGVALVYALATLGWLATYYSDTGSNPVILMSTTALGVLLIPAFLLSVVPILIWIYRAHSNLRREKLDGLQFVPGWVIASYFIPLVNLVIPFLAMRELYNRSMGEPAEFANISAGDVTSWWSCHVAAVFVYMIVMLTGMVDALRLVGISLGFIFTTPFWANMILTVFAMLLLAGSGWFLQKIIASVTEAQQMGVNVEATFA